MEFCKSKLSPFRRQTYELILNAMQRDENRVQVDSCIDKEEGAIVYNSVLIDHPELFNSSNSSAILRMGLNRATYIEWGKIYNPIIANRYYRIINQILADMSKKTKTMSDVEKLKYIANYIFDNVKYEVDIKRNQNAAAALCCHKAQCSGIAKAVTMLCEAVNIESITVYGQALDGKNKREAHSWNIVNVDGKYTHLDVTYMMPLNKDPERRNYKYLAINDNAISSDHFWDTSIYPKCTATIEVDNGKPSNPNCPIIDNLIELKAYLIDRLKEHATQIEFDSRIRAKDNNTLLQYVMRTMSNALIEAGAPLCNVHTDIYAPSIVKITITQC